MTAVTPPSRSGARASLLWVLCPEEFETTARSLQEGANRLEKHSQTTGTASNKAALPLNARLDGSMR